MSRVSRRQWLAGSAAAFVSAQARPEQGHPPKRVAALITEYKPGTHADVIVGKILEGYLHDGGVKPNLKVAGMFVDQFPGGDVSRRLSRKHEVPIFKTIEGALTLGKKTLAVDGVLLIGEHGYYPVNDKGTKSWLPTSRSAHVPGRTSCIW